MKRFVRCQNCNRRLYGTDLLIVDSSNRVDELFCSHRCIKQYYGYYLGSRLATQPITVDEYFEK